MPRSEGDLNIPSRTPSPRSSASQAPPNPRHNADEPSPRVNIHPSQPLPSSGSSHPFKGLSRKFMSKSGHQRGRSEGAKVYDIGPSNQPPNVKDRVRKWQEAVTPGETADLWPPISPATPTPGKSAGPRMREHVRSGLGGEYKPQGPRAANTETPLSPPRAPALVNREQWDSASESEKEAERMRAKSRDRERRLNRRRAARPGSSTRTPDRPRETPVTTPDKPRTVSHTPEAPAPKPAVVPATTSAPATPAPPVTSYDDGIRVAPIVNDNDGIRVTPVRKPKRRTSGARRRKRNQEEREARAAEEASKAALEDQKPEEEPARAPVRDKPELTKTVEKQPEPPKPTPSSRQAAPKPPVDLAEILRPAERPKSSTSRIPDTAFTRLATTPLSPPLAMYQVEKWDDEEQTETKRSASASTLPKADDDGIQVVGSTTSSAAPTRTTTTSDGIRVFPGASTAASSTTAPPSTSKPPTTYSSRLETPVVRSGPAYRKPSVRQSARSVKSRKDAFEAQMNGGVVKESLDENVPSKEHELLIKASQDKLASLDSAPPAPAPVKVDTAREEMLKEALKPLDNDGIRVKPVVANNDGIRVQPVLADDGIQVQAETEQDPVKTEVPAPVEETVKPDSSAPKEEISKSKLEGQDDGIRVTGSAVSEPRTVKSELLDDGIRVRPMKDEFDDGIRVKPLKTKRNRRKRSSDKLKPRPKSMHEPILNTEDLAASDLTEPLQPPEMSTETESAPATPTGRTRRMRRDTAPSSLLSVKDRARMFDQGDPWVIESETAPITPTIAQLPKESVDAEPSQARPRRSSHSEEEGMTREERRQHRRELRRALNEAEEERIKAAQFRAAQKKLAADRDSGRASASKDAPSAKGKEKEIPKVPARPSSKPRAEKRTTPISSAEHLPLKRERTKTRHPTSGTSSESLPLRRTDYEVEREVARAGKQRADSPGYLRANEKVKPANPIVPKIAAAAGTFFKIVKEELQGRSVRTIVEVEPETSSAEDAKEGPRGAGEVESEESSTESSSDSDAQSESESERERVKRDVPVKKERAPKPKAPVKAEAPVKKPVVYSSDSEQTQSEPEAPRPRRGKSRRRRRRYSKRKKPVSPVDSYSSSSESPAPKAPLPKPAEKAPLPKPVVEKAPSPKVTPPASPAPKVTQGPAQKTPVSDTTSSSLSSSSSTSSSSSEETEKEAPKAPPPERAPSKRRRRRGPSVRRCTPTPPPVESPTTFELPESAPVSKLKRRAPRNRTAPSRPKSIHSRAGSEGTISQKTSVCGDDASSIADTEPISLRNVSDASSIKPLRFNKSKTEPVHVRKSSRGSNATPPPVTITAPPEDQDDPEDWYNPEVSVKAPGLRRKFTKHADLISILSVDREDATTNQRPASIRSHRSKRSHNSQPRSPRSSKPNSRQDKPPNVVETMSIADLVQELNSDEVRYMRELRTLVDHVVPVLFQTVLGRADDHLRRTSSTSSVGTALSGISGISGASSRSFQANPTRPIVDIGITLERLKSLHERLQSAAQDTDRLMKWATDARRMYEEYLSVWRMGFQDVIISMSTVAEDEKVVRGKDAVIRKELGVIHGAEMKFEGDMSTWDLPPPPVQEEEGEDEKVDVAFLLKRPLVRLKALAKLFKRIHYITSSPVALSLSNGFYDLVMVARKKISEEKARIEDEVAASLDTSKVIDIRLLLPCSDITLDPTRRVKARDSFFMRLYHSSGEVLERPIELILREASPRSKQSEAEVLIVETSEGGSKWLLFPPVTLSTISARGGDAHKEVVAMVRGLDQDLQEWREVMALVSETAAGFEWVQMLGMEPAPPAGPFAEEYHEPTYLDTVAEESVVSARPVVKMKPKKQRKHALESSRTKLESRKAEAAAARQAQAEADAAAAAAAAMADENALKIDIPEEIVEEEVYDETQSFVRPDWLPPYLTAVSVVGYPAVGGELKIPKNINWDFLDVDDDDDRSVHRSPSLHTLSDTPRMKSGSLQRSRKASRPNAARRNSLRVEDEDEHTGGILGYPPSETTLRRSKSIHYDEDDTPLREGSPSLVGKSPFDSMPILAPTGAQEQSVPPPVPPHRTPSPSSNGSPPVESPRAPFAQRRRTSSPLKHQWDPSSSSESGSGTEIAPVRQQNAHPASADVSTDVSSASDDDYTSGYSSEEDSETSSDTSDVESELCSEEEDEAEEYPHPMLNIPRNPSRKPSLVTLTRAKSVLSIRSKADDTSTVIPEERITDVPNVPPPPIPAQLGGYSYRVTTFKWVTNQWEKVLPGEIKVVITPGLIEAFPLIASPDGYGVPQIGGTGMLASMQNLLWSLEVTHDLVVRRGTAVDISIRTPPTSSFQGTNIMLRSRSPAECGNLYAAMVDNATRPPTIQEPTLLSTVVPSEMGTSVTSTTTFGGSIKRGFAWGRRKSYRAGGGSTPSLISTPSQTSVTSLSSAFSRFKPSFFKNSPLGSVASSSSTSLMGSSGGPPVELSTIVDVGNWVIAMQPLKIKLYKRESSLKWREMGSARLHVLKPPALNSWDERKRIIVTTRKGDVVHIDQALGEAAFERIGRTGMAVNIFTGEGAEDVRHHGGIGAKNLVYMFQMKSEAEASYSFTILGKFRY